MTTRAPVAMMVFNRPDLTTRLFEVVRAARPSRLLVVADGPRPGRPGEAEACARVRAAVDRVDWPCEVEREFSEVNLGCRRRISSGLDWVFRQAEEAIILEDDCIPDPAFFRFCDEVLERHRGDERIMAVTGCNYLFGRPRGTASYYFSHHMLVWGWASWRRAWRHYDVAMTDWPAFRRGPWLRDVLGSRAAAAGLRYRLDLTHAGRIDTWDYQWSFAILRREGLVATPSVNLVRNVGAGPDATHPTEEGLLHNQTVGQFAFPIVHPDEIRRDVEADALVQRLFTPSPRTLLSMAARRILGMV